MQRDSDLFYFKIFEVLLLCSTKIKLLPLFHFPNTSELRAPLSFAFESENLKLRYAAMVKRLLFFSCTHGCTPQVGDPPPKEG